MAEWVAGRGTTALGVVGTVLGGLATAMAGGVGTGLLGNATRNGSSYEAQYATIHDVNDAKELAYKDAEIALLKADQTTNTKIIDTYKELAGRISTLEKAENEKWTSQMVINANVNSTLNVLSSQGQTISNTLANITRVAVPKSSVCDFNNGCNCDL